MESSKGTVLVAFVSIALTYLLSPPAIAKVSIYASRSEKESCPKTGHSSRHVRVSKRTSEGTLSVDNVEESAAESNDDGLPGNYTGNYAGSQLNKTFHIVNHESGQPTHFPAKDKVKPPGKCTQQQVKSALKSDHLKTCLEVCDEDEEKFMLFVSPKSPVKKFRKVYGKSPTEAGKIVSETFPCWLLCVTSAVNGLGCGTKEETNAYCEDLAKYYIDEPVLDETIMTAGAYEDEVKPGVKIDKDVCTPKGEKSCSRGFSALAILSIFAILAFLT